MYVLGARHCPGLDAGEHLLAGLVEPLDCCNSRRRRRRQPLLSLALLLLLRCLQFKILLAHSRLQDGAGNKGEIFKASSCCCLYNINNASKKIGSLYLFWEVLRRTWEKKPLFDVVETRGH